MEVQHTSKCVGKLHNDCIFFISCVISSDVARYSKTPQEVLRDRAEGQATTGASTGYTVLGPGDMCGEIAFFTEIAQLEVSRRVCLLVHMQALVGGVHAAVKCMYYLMCACTWL